MRALASWLAASTLVVTAACVLPDYEGRTEGSGGAGPSTSVIGVSVGSGGDGATSTATGSASSVTSGETTAASSSSGGDGGAGAGGDGGAPATTSVVASTGVGGGCAEPLGACLGAVATDFHEPYDVPTLWNVVAPAALEAGDHLLLQPEGTQAVVVSLEPVEVHSGPCAIWVKLERVTTEGACGLALGLGDVEDAWFRVERFGTSLRAYAEGVKVTDIPFEEDEMLELRVRIDDETAFLEVSKDGNCWKLLSGPHPLPAGNPYVRLDHVGAGETQMDDYCR